MISRSSPTPRPPRSPLFPYTTLFRSDMAMTINRQYARHVRAANRAAADGTFDVVIIPYTGNYRCFTFVKGPVGGGAVGRSEEHTSELQSHSDLVCRLLLEKKKNKQCT